MEDFQQMLREEDPEKVLFYLEYYEMIMDMHKKRFQENGLENDYLLLKERFKELTEK